MELNMIEKNICQLLEQGEDFVLATILTQKGSTPRLPGTKMIIRSDGSIIGTIGGGLPEADIIKTAAEIFKTGIPRTRIFQMNSNITESMDMICGGESEILIELIRANTENKSLFHNLLNLIQNRQKPILVTAMMGEGEFLKEIERSLFVNNSLIHGNFSLSDVFLSSKTSELFTNPEYNRRFLIEPFFNNETVYIFGAGHISKELAVLTKMVGFKTVVLDDRKEFANSERFQNADEIRVLSSFEDPFSDLNIDQDSYIVILTRGHHYDKTVLEKALRTSAGYIGMIGSHKKRDAIYQALLKEGFTNDELKKVHSPIGLKIGAKTPEEIAVSIVAELIHIRALKIKP